MSRDTILTTVVVTLLNSGVVVAFVSYFKDRKKLPYEVDSIIASSTGAALNSMSVALTEQKSLNRDLQDKLDRKNSGIVQVVSDIEALNCGSCPLGTILVSLRKLLW